MYRQNSVSLILPAFNEEKNIAAAIKDFKAQKIFDEIIIIDNNSNDGTVKIASRLGVRIIKENRQGYGFALQTGMQKACGNYIVLCEPDGTFRAADSKKLISRLKNSDCVFGTRTNKKFIQRGSNMAFLLRTGNFLLAKIVQLLYQTNNLTDCGCTFRAFKKEVVKKILPNLSVGGSYFLADLTTEIALANYRFIEIPVFYNKRVGTSKITGSLPKTVKVGWQMLRLIIGKRFGSKSY